MFLFPKDIKQTKFKVNNILLSKLVSKNESSKVLSIIAFFKILPVTEN